MNRIGKLTAASALALFLAACGGGAVSGGSSTQHKGSTPNSTSALPGKPVCELVSMEKVGRIIDMPVYSTGNDDQPTTCNYYTDTDGLGNIYIKWMTEKEAFWPEQVAAAGNTPSGVTVEQIPGADFGGSEALKETITHAGDTSVAYLVLLKKKGIVLHVQEVNGLSDGKLRALTRAVVRDI